METGWTMLLGDCEAKPPASSWGFERQADNAWLFVDPLTADRFTHPGETIVPGAGVRYAKVIERRPPDCPQRRKRRMHGPGE